MTPEEEQQIVFALSQVQAFFGKELDDLQTDLWMRAMRKYPMDLVKRALADYTEVGKFAPKPRDIIELIEGLRDQKRRDNPAPLPEPKGKVASPEVARAWRYAISQWNSDAGGMFKDPNLTEEQIEEAIMLVNQQVKQSGNWDAIPPHLWLESVQGRPYPGEAA